MILPSKRIIYCIGAILVVHQVGSMCLGETSKPKHEAVPTKYDQTPDDGDGSGTRILSRKRRFLSFPEGSSYQVVMDQTIPIVSKTLVYSVGITVALAWQLPTISLFTIAKLLREKTVDSGAFRRTDENINATTLIETSTRRNNQSHTNSYYYDNPYNKSYNRRPNGLDHNSSNYNDLHQLHQQHQLSTRKGYSNRINYYTTVNGSSYGPYDIYRPQWQTAQHRGFLTDNLPLNFLSPFNWTRHDWSSLVARYLQTWIGKHPPNYQQSGRQFYPVFGKRSIDEHTHPEDKFFLNHHRSTRHELYLQIEKFLEAKGKHGHHCVLRALCESGQRKHGNEPKPFLKSIMKAVFSMPTTHEASTHHKHRMYDEAHGHVGRCAEKFSLCQDSIWSEDFLF
ncbi:uncharacterized protein LOC135712149 [Ochlerotatus camptorhynchus]|uniref:uncharacterized protein LOC135712149 n=1 Tax=Ochlerotatus camptorhynchus TaxID=644619 RepID=UPI0031D99982